MINTNMNENYWLPLRLAEEQSSWRSQSSPVIILETEKGGWDLVQGEAHWTEGSCLQAFDSQPGRFIIIATRGCESIQVRCILIKNLFLLTM